MLRALELVISQCDCVSGNRPNLGLRTSRTSPVFSPLPGGSFLALVSRGHLALGAQSHWGSLHPSPLFSDSTGQSACGRIWV